MSVWGAGWVALLMVCVWRKNNKKKSEKYDGDVGGYDGGGNGGDVMIMII